ncbi:hypothetical protein A2U01_0090702, partial [Trifolium medium]|nr:hypothetical protein [Trifolium medium]
YDKRHGTRLDQQGHSWIFQTGLISLLVGAVGCSPDGTTTR